MTAPAAPRMVGPGWLSLFRAELLEAAALHNVPTARLAALVEQESAGEPRAYRYEPTFWTKYLAKRVDYAPPAPGVLALGAWMRRVSASYGLCQIMYATARDFGLPPELPPEALFQPRMNLTLGAKILASHRKRSADWRETWLRYNGGGRPAYADEIEARVPRFEALLSGGVRA